MAGIYSDGYLMHNKTAKAKWKRGDWNHFKVRCTGFDMHIQVWMNGQLVTDYRLPRDSDGYAPTGLIGLQVHGARGEGERAARFRAIKVRELPLFGHGDFEPGSSQRSDVLKLTSAGREAGWQPLFNGEDYTGWEVKGPEQTFGVRDGAMIFTCPGGGGHVQTTESFKDFRLRLDFRTGKLGNSGVFLRAVHDGGNPSYSGCEIQILDDFNWEEVTNSKLKEWQFSGSLYGAVPPGSRDALHDIGSWNTYEILYRGSRLAVALNGKTLYDVDTHALEAAKPPFAERAPEGFIGLQHHSPSQAREGPILWFRNLYVQRL